jgi:hypothetical protein
MSVMQQAHKMHTRQEDCFWGLKSKSKNVLTPTCIKYFEEHERERRPSALRPPTRWSLVLFFQTKGNSSLSVSKRLYAMRSIIHATLRQHLLNKRARTTFSSLVEKTMQM